MNLRLPVVLALGLTLHAFTASAAAQASRGPGRGGPPPARAPERADLRAFELCYAAEDFPQLAVAVLIAQPQGRLSQNDALYRDMLENELVRTFNGADVRLVPPTRVAELRGADVDALVAAREWGRAADLIAQGVDAERVFLVTLIPMGADARGASRFTGRYALFDTTNDRQIDARNFTAPILGMSNADRGRVPRSLPATVNGLAREIIRGYVENVCAAPARPGTPRESRDATGTGGIAVPGPGIDGPPEEGFVGPAREVDVRIVGEFDRRDPAEIVRSVRDYEYIKHVIGSPTVTDTGPDRSISMTISAFGDPFLIGDDLSFAIFLATGKDSRVTSADQTAVVLEVLDPARSRWLGATDERNEGVRRALQNAWQRQGRPTIAFVTREVVGQDRNQATGFTGVWSWFHAIDRELWEDAGEPRDWAGAALANELAGRLLDVGLRAADGAQIFSQFATDQERDDPRNLEEVLRRRGFSMIANGRGEVSRSPQETDVSFAFDVQSLDSSIIEATSGVVHRYLSRGGNVAVNTADLGDELAAGLIDRLFNTWTEGLSITSIVLVDDTSVEQSDRIRSAIEASIEGVEYTAFRAIGEDGQIVEVGHRNPAVRDQIRTALTTGEWGETFDIIEGSTDARFRAEIAE